MPKPKQRERSGLEPKRKRSVLSARTADPHDLYQRSVQEPDVDVALIDRVFRKEHGRRPRSLREDFCGTALISAAWVRSRPDRTAIGVDLDAATLAWARRHNLAPLGAAAARATPLRRDVLRVTRPKVDVVCAFNFSYCVFQRRAQLLAYFGAVRRSLREGGAFVLDNHAGPNTFEESWDERKFAGYHYIWEQEPVDGISHRGVRRIHFRFRDGSWLKNAFRYDWRIWTVAELRDLADEAGFRRCDVYTELLDDDGEPITGLRRLRRHPHDDSWTPYLVCWR
jgi:SAM-dependent methyltransferase